MRLTADVHLVGSGESGLNLTAPFDCHVYAIDGGSEAALVDAGCGGGVEDILSEIRASDLDEDRIRQVFLTHAHPDHSGGLAALKERLPHLQVVASPAVAGWVESGDEGGMSLEMGKRAEFYPPDYRFTPCPVDRRVTGGERIMVGALELEVVETPGHADGHLAFLGRGSDRRLLFSGDLLFYGGTISLANNWDCRIQEYARSMAKLAGAGIDALLPGHHQMSLREGQRHIDTANRLFHRGFVPKSVV